MAHGHECIGNLLIGDHARSRFLSLPEPTPLGHHEFPRLAEAAAVGGEAGSSAGGEQPKFVAYVNTSDGPRHAIVKFAGSGNAIQARWQDLLVAEHLALETLRSYGQRTSTSWVVDEAGQRFLISERFDRVGVLGRRALMSLSALNSEFVANGSQTWPEITKALLADGRVTNDSVPQVQTLWAFGALIGNTDMHLGNLAFWSEDDLPYDLAPAYDMLPMAFAPTRAGDLPLELKPVNLVPSVPPDIWQFAHTMATDYVSRLRTDDRISEAFFDCIEVLDTHLVMAKSMITRII
jgi:hypothetical protein